MVQTDLNSDNFCGFNQSASPFYYTMDPVQNNVQFKVGEVGVFPSVGVHTPGDVIKVDSYLKDIGNVLTKCNLPVPANTVSQNNCENENNYKKEINNQDSSDSHNSQESLISNLNKYNQEKLKQETEFFKNYEYKNMNDFKEVQNKSTFLLPSYTREKGCAKDLSAIDLQAGFSGNKGNLFTNPQDLTHIIEKGIALQRGGLVSNQLIKETYKFKTPALGNDVKTGCKIKTLYPTYAPFGLNYAINDKNISQHFNAIDVISTGASSPDYGQVENAPFNNDAPYTNGGCNKVSMVKHNICNEVVN